MPQQPVQNPLGLPFVELQSVDSTNNYARQQIHAGLAQHGMLVFAHEQLAGKGQRGRNWTSEKDRNIMLSLVLKEPPLQLSEQFQLIASISVAVQEFYSKYGGSETRIKWPNDVYWQDRKAGGVLIENVIGEGIGGAVPIAIGSGARKSSAVQIWKWAIVGIGININQVSFPPELKNPVSLKQITGKNFDPVELSKELVHTIQKWYDELQQNGFGKILDLYNEQLYKKNETVRLKKGNVIFNGRIDAISESGKLSVTHSIQEEFEFGQIEWLVD